MSEAVMQQASQIGLFLVRYDVGGDKPGAPLFKLQLSVSTPGETVSGVGHVTQAIDPPLDVLTSLQGHFTYMTVMPDTSQILVEATGRPTLQWPRGGGLGPVVLPNVELRMVLSTDWKSGTADYQYSVGNGAWNSVTGAPVNLVGPIPQ